MCVRSGHPRFGPDRPGISLGQPDLLFAIRRVRLHARRVIPPEPQPAVQPLDQRLRRAFASRCASLLDRTSSRSRSSSYTPFALTPSSCATAGAGHPAQYNSTARSCTSAGHVRHPRTSRAYSSRRLRAMPALFNAAKTWPGVQPSSSAISGALLVAYSAASQAGSARRAAVVPSTGWRPRGKEMPCRRRVVRTMAGSSCSAAAISGAGGVGREDAGVAGDEFGWAWHGYRVRWWNGLVGGLSGRGRGGSSGASLWPRATQEYSPKLSVTPSLPGAKSAMKQSQPCLSQEIASSQKRSYQ